MTFLISKITLSNIVPIGGQNIQVLNITQEWVIRFLISHKF